MPRALGGASRAQVQATTGVHPPAPGSQAALNPQPLPPGATRSTAGGIPSQPVGGFGARHLQTMNEQGNRQAGQSRGVVGPVAPQLPQQSMSAPGRSATTSGAARSALLPSGITVKPPEPIAVNAAALRINVTAPLPAQDIVVNATPLQLKVIAAAPLPDIVVSAAPLRFSVTPGTSKMFVRRALDLNAIAVDAAPLRFNATAAAPTKPIVVDASALTLKASAMPPLAPVALNAAPLKLTVTQP